MNALAGHLNEHGLETQIVEPAYRPKLKPDSVIGNVLRNYRYFKIDRAWREYCGIKSRFRFIHLIAALGKNIFKKGCKASRDFVVSANHITGWELAMDCNADFILCCEDDIIFKDDSCERILALIKDLESRYYYPENNYIDLAGGCEIGMLGIGKLETRKDAGFRYYSKPVTNTACCYLINWDICRHFLYQISRKGRPNLGADWLMNVLFIRLERERIPISCRHADPPIFKHGSFTGEYLSCNGNG